MGASSILSEGSEPTSRRWHRLLWWCLGGSVLGGLAAYGMLGTAWHDQDLSQRLLGSSWSHWMGTDVLGRDLMARVLYGAAVSVGVGGVSTFLSFVVGTGVGAVAGWGPVWCGRVLLAGVDILLAVPRLVFLILIQVAFDLLFVTWDPQWRGLFGIVIGLSVLGWMTVARMVFYEVRRLRAEPFVTAGRALGKPHWQSLVGDALPNIYGPLAVLFTFRMSGNILYESFLSFIGLGLQAPYASWGKLVAEGMNHMDSAPHLALWPGVTLVVALLGIQLMGDGLRLRWDPERRLAEPKTQRHG